VFGHNAPNRKVIGGCQLELLGSVQAVKGFIYHILRERSQSLSEDRATEPELQRMLANSPLRSHLTVSPDIPLPSRLWRWASAMWHCSWPAATSMAWFTRKGNAHVVRALAETRVCVDVTDTLTRMAALPPRQPSQNESNCGQDG